MKTVRVLAALATLAVALLLSGCAGFPLKSLIGSGQTVSRDYDLAGFDSVQTGNAFDLAITQGDTYAVKVTVDDNVADNLIVEKRGNTLVITLRPGAYSTLTLQAEITMPALAKLALSGASSAALVGFAGGDQFDASLSGASRLTGEMSATHTELDVSGASSVTLSGNGDSLEVKGSGGSKLNLGDLAVQSASVDLSGATSALVNAVQALDVTAGGASSVEYLGDPAHVSEKTSGASSVRRH